MRWLATVLGWGAAVYVGLALYLYVFQARYIYFPDLPSRQVEATPADIGLTFQALTLSTSDGEALAGWFIPASAARGTPSEEGTYRDALAAWNYLTQEKRLAPERVVVFGESLGGAVAAWLAARQPPAGLVIYASFTSVPEMAQVLYPMFPASRLARYRYDTRAALRGVNCPVLILHSPEDEIIPFSHGQALLAAAREPKRLVELRGGHNDALQASREVYTREIGAFLQQFLRS